MKLALALALALGCSSPAKKTDGTTPSGGGQPSPTTTETAAKATPASSGTPGTPTAGAVAGQPTAKAKYSCFSYTAKNSTKKRFGCSKTDECQSYLDQVKSVGGIREVTGCESVAAVFCFHRAPTADEPEGDDVCQPSLDECKTGRADVVKAKMSVDTECAQK